MGDEHVSEAIQYADAGVFDPADPIIQHALGGRPAGLLSEPT